MICVRPEILLMGVENTPIPIYSSPSSSTNRFGIIILNRPCLYSQFWTGITCSLQWRPIHVSLKRDICDLHLEKTCHISLRCKLVPVNTRQSSALLQLGSCHQWDHIFFTGKKLSVLFTVWKILLLATKSENVRDSWPQGFSLKVTPCWWHEYGLFND